MNNQYANRSKAKFGDIIRNEPIQYSILHPSSPLQIEVMHPENRSGLQVIVDRYAGGGWANDSLESKAANTYVTITNILNGMHDTMDESPKTWATNKKYLEVFPFAGQALNAVYNRKHLAFFYAQDPKDASWYFTAESSDIVAHELGHAILDAYRPDLWNAASIEIWAFHEAFGDMLALISLLQHKEIITHLINENGGDLRQPNIISGIAEGFSQLVNKSSSLRSSINSFKYIDPQILPRKASEKNLGREPHSFSRIFLGAFYDILVMIYETELQKGSSPSRALGIARNILTRYLGKSIQKAPASVKFFESVAKTILWVDWAFNAKTYHDKMYQIFLDRNIIQADLIKPQIIGKNGNVTKFENGYVVSNSKLAKLRKNALSSFLMEDVNIWMPCDASYLYDDTGHLVSTHATTEEETQEGVGELVEFLETFKVEKPFEVSDGQLKRTVICCCSTPNKNSPEFLRPYKPENNSGGCCGGCRQTAANTVEKRKVLRGCFIRYKVGK